MNTDNVILRRLTDDDFDDLLNAVNTSFADYIVPFKLNEEQLKFKILSEDIVMQWSVGVFLDNKLIAFIMHGVRTLDSKRVVYNAGTGVLPDYRGKGFVGKMYEFINPFLKQNEVKELVLEVIASNNSAIRAYEKDGFTVRRKLLCFGGKVETTINHSNVCLLPLNKLLWADFVAFWDIQPSWQSYINSMDNLQPDALGAFIEGKLVGYVLFSKEMKRVYQIAVSKNHRRKGIASHLIKEAYQATNAEILQVNNIDSTCESIKLFLERQGLVNDINQFEMMKSLF
ncbi:MULTISPECIES: GNAT family N-acetyltransferase [Sphingobacterium]|uniref:GNAT family N-acetyltransferase n=1 Tax=Sphingobacterium TaxID=28453 RepID=UPI0025800C57|nr:MULTISPECIES: GNAT family N-acetyltransferase [Sphingobacterium]